MMQEEQCKTHLNNQCMYNEITQDSLHTSGNFYQMIKGY